jgi:hypothetical protein
LEKFVPVGAPGAVNPKFVEEPQIPFDKLRAGFSTPFGQKRPNSAQDDTAVMMRTLDSGH